MNNVNIEVPSGRIEEKCGARENKLKEVLENYKQICLANLANFECGNIDKKELLKTVRNLFDHLFEQNTLLVNSLEKRDDELIKLASKKLNIDEKVDNTPTDSTCSCDVLSYKNQIASLEDDLKNKAVELDAVRDKMKTLEDGLKGENWALALEVNEKHGEASKLRQTVSDLEEKLRQAHMQTHLKDDIIKQMRSQLKDSSRLKGPKLCDVVTEITHQQKLRETKMTVAGEITEGAATNIAEPGMSGAVRSTESRTQTPREQVASLREILLADIQKFETPNTSDDLKNAADDKNGKQVKYNRLSDLGGGDGVDSSVSADTSSSLISGYTPFDDKSQNFELNQVCSQIDSLISSAKTTEDSSMNEHRQAIRKELEIYLNEKGGAKSPSNSEEDLQQHLKKKDETIENLQRELKNLKEGFNASERNVDHFIHFVDNVLKKLPVYNSISINNTESSKESLEQKQTILESTISNICDELAAERKLVSNNAEILRNLHGTVQLRENQMKSFSSKVQELERLLEEQRKEITDLQQALQNCKKVELKQKDQEIRSLRFGFCELEEKQLFYEKKCKNLKFALEQAQSENNLFIEKLSFLERVVPRLRDLHEISALYKEKNLELEHHLLEREAEVNQLQNQVNKLENKMDMEVERNEKRMTLDGMVIGTLRDKNNSLLSELTQLNLDHRLQKSQVTDQQIKIKHLEKIFIEAKRYHETKVEDLERKLTSFENERKSMVQKNDQTVTILTRNLKTELDNKVELNKKLDECQAELQTTINQLEKVTIDYEELEKNNERAQNNLNKMLTSVGNEKEKLKTERDFLEGELTEIKAENIICSERISSILNREAKLKLEYEKEISMLRRNLAMEMTKVQDCEAEISKLNEKNDHLRVAAYDANENCNRMQLYSSIICESHGKMADDFRCRQDGWRETHECSQDMHHIKTHGLNGSRCDPWMPTPPAAQSLWKNNRTQLHDSSEGFVESGFQSMMPSPVPTMSDTPTCSYDHESALMQRMVR